MDIISVNEHNIEREHICCAISEQKGETCISSKKAWLRERFQDGLVFKKLDVRGKVFIEYLPAENAWCPITADGYLYINCLWVSGQYKGQGYANQLLEQCIADGKAEGKYGLTILSSPKKKPFLSDPKFLAHKGFMTADSAEPYFELCYLPFSKEAPAPKFKACAKQGKIEETDMVVYYSDQCPFAAKYARLLQAIAQQRGVPFLLHKWESVQQAQNAPSPYTTFSFYHHGSFVTNEILSEKKFIKYLDDHGL